MDAAAMRELVQSTIAATEFVRATFGGPRRGGTGDGIKATVRRSDRRYYFERFTAKQSFASTVTAEQLISEVDQLISLKFSSIQLQTKSETIEIRLSKKGKVFVGRSAANSLTDATHNRVKQQPMPEGEANPLLEAMGILDRHGIVRPTMRAKFTQVNQFLRHFGDLYTGSGLESLERPIRILDAGCGSSYLTLAVYDFLNRTLRKTATILGVDVNDEVIRKSTERAQKLGAEGIRFACERIGEVAESPDVVIALHACDTATDAALAAAVKHRAALILAAPCCHHHLNAQLKAANAEVLRPVLRHGILHERQADLFTDAFRALLLKIHGYSAEVVEFVSAEHTARNLMIRAVRTSVTPSPQFREEYEALKAFLGVTPYLEKLIPPAESVGYMTLAKNLE